MHSVLHQRDRGSLRRTLHTVDLLLAADPDHRPSMQSVMVHPLWWPPPQRLAFLIAVSDRVEGEDRAVSKTCWVPCCHVPFLWAVSFVA